MTMAVTNPAQPQRASGGQPSSRRTRRRVRGEGESILARGEPVLWVLGAALVISIAMIIGLLLLVLYQGVTTFWPVPIVELSTVSGDVLMGEVTRRESYTLDYARLTTLSGPPRDAAARLLLPELHRGVTGAIDTANGNAAGSNDQQIAERILELSAASGSLAQSAAVTDVLQPALTKAIASLPADDRQRSLAAIARAATDTSGQALFDLWTRVRLAAEEWLDLGDAQRMATDLDPSSNRLVDLLTYEQLARQVAEVQIDVERHLLRTGNFELTGEHFRWVSDFEIAPDGEQRPPWAIIFERLTWGRFYGRPKSILVAGELFSAPPADVWDLFQQHHVEVRKRWQARRNLESIDIGDINRQQERARLALRKTELRYGRDSPQWQTQHEEVEQQLLRWEDDFLDIRREIDSIDTQNAGYQLVVETADGTEQRIDLADIVRAYPANQVSASDKSRIYLSRWWEFLSDSPREANSEGGVLPAIWGTVAMTLLMSVAVVPFGVLAALYLREYAKAGLLVSIVRIAVNNLAGVPSIVFGVFGLGFFCYVLGATLDELLFAEKLPSPTLGTGGLMWAALTLALLTLPVVIVATEEALAAVPRTMREGSLACGATQWQTIRRIVLPRAMPGIMTGMILAMARGAGEVAPLMLVGAVKLAPELPIDGIFPYIHFERSFMHLGFHIYDLGFQSQNSEAAKPMVFTTTLLLIAIVALMNVLAIALRSRLRKRFVYSQF